MEFQSYVSWISSPVQIAFLDLVLGADNAFIIALVCRALPRQQRMRVMIVGTSAALLLRLVLTLLAGGLMYVPLLRLIGGIVLVLIAISLTDEINFGDLATHELDNVAHGRLDAQARSEIFWDAILVVTLADGIMSLDNSVALAAVAKGNVIYLTLGLALSVPTLVFGSWLLSELLGQTPFLATFAMAVLAWVAGDMAVSDPLVAGWITTDAPALALAVPIAAVIFVLAKSASRPAMAASASVVGSGSVDVEIHDALSAHADEPELALDIPSVVQKPEIRIVPAPTISSHQDLDTAPAAFALSAPAESEPVRKRTVEERLVVAGLVALFSVAALIMAAAIYFGNATF